MELELTEAPQPREILPPPPDTSREVFELVKMVALFLLLFWAIKSFVVEGYEVQGESMTPTLTEEERILVFKLGHQLSRLSFLPVFPAIKPGDIVVFDSDEQNKRYVKRIIAAGPPAPHGNKVAAGPRDEFDRDTEKVHVEYRHGLVYVDYVPLEEDYLQDIERHSRDTVVEDIGPGQYFVMGDHRSVSKDSRSFGPVNDEQIVGRAVLRFWPLSKFGLL